VTDIDVKGGKKHWDITSNNTRCRSNLARTQEKENGKIQSCGPKRTEKDHTDNSAIKTQTCQRTEKKIVQTNKRKEKQIRSSSSRRSYGSTWPKMEMKVTGITGGGGRQRTKGFYRNPLFGDGERRDKMVICGTPQNRENK